MSGDDIMDAWAKWRIKAEALAAECMASPQQAVLHGVAQIHDRANESFGFGARQATPRNEQAAWLRGVATSLIPPEFKWKVMEMVGGGAALVLLSYDPKEDYLETGVIP